MTPSRALLPVFREIGDLKRVTSAGRDGSIATRAFATAWGEVVRGRDAEAVALDVTAACLAATRLGDLDAASLGSLGLSADEVARVQRQAVAEIGTVIPAALVARLADRCVPLPPLLGGGARVPAFVAALAAQPRAGATCPGRARVVLGPPENHADHCLVVAVYAVLLAEPGADLGAAFLAALAHHLHNADMPDAGFAGEMLLGPHLDAVMATATTAALAELPTEIAGQVTAARRILPDAENAEGRAFNAADVIDRVLEIEQHLARSQVTMGSILGEMALVHEGPLKAFHDRVLGEIGLS